MILRPLSLALLCSFLFGGCALSPFSASSVVLKGSPNTVIFVPQMRMIHGKPQIMPGQYSLFRAGDLPQGSNARYYRHQLRGKSISTASMDPQSGTLRFPLEVQAGADYTLPVCLVIMGPQGKVPVRPSASNKDMYHFRNPMWEEAMAHLNSIRNAGDNLISIRQQELQAQSRVNQVFTDLQKFNAKSYEECLEGPAVQAPEPEPTVVKKDQQNKVASQACAAVWREEIGAAAEKLYSQTNKSESWKGRDKGQIFLKQANWKIKIKMGKRDLGKVRMAGQDGELFSHFDDGVELFSTKTIECETMLGNSLKQELQKWEKARDHALSAPTRFLQHCQATAKSYEEQKAQLVSLSSEREKAKDLFDSMTPKEYKENEFQPLDPFTCTRN